MAKYNRFPYSVTVRAQDDLEYVVYDNKMNIVNVFPFSVRGGGCISHIGATDSFLAPFTGKSVKEIIKYFNSVYPKGHAVLRYSRADRADRRRYL